MQARVPVTFAPAGVDGVGAAGRPCSPTQRGRLACCLAAPCGGRGVCAGCGVRVISGQLEPADEFESATPQARSRGRAACMPGACDRAGRGATGLLGNAESVRSPAGRLARLPRSRRVGRGCRPGDDVGRGRCLSTPTAARETRARRACPTSSRRYGADVLVAHQSAALAGEAHELRQRWPTQSVAAALEAAAYRGRSVDVSGVERLVIAGNSAMAALAGWSRRDRRSPRIPSRRRQERDRLAATSPVRDLLPDAAEVGVRAADRRVSSAVTRWRPRCRGGLVDVDEPMLLVDFGTNAEIVLAGAGPLVVASAAAGPAFEGVGVSCWRARGSRARSQRVEIDCRRCVALQCDRRRGTALVLWIRARLGDCGASLARVTSTSAASCTPSGPLGSEFGRDGCAAFSRFGCRRTGRRDCRAHAARRACAAARQGRGARGHRRRCCAAAGVAASELGGVLRRGRLRRRARSRRTSWSSVSFRSKSPSSASGASATPRSTGQQRSRSTPALVELAARELRATRRAR